MRFGLLTNAGEFPGYTHSQIYDLTLEQARLAEVLGYADIWLTEHHFIGFGINSSSLVAAAFLLGQTKTLRVGTAVTLSPLYHPVQLAEQVAILDQMSGGRFDLGIGRGGYRLDYDVFGIPYERWQNEVHATGEVLLNVWTNPEATSIAEPFLFESLPVNPRPRTNPHPPLFIASAGGESLALAARNRLPIQHYFATPAEARIGAEGRYVDAARAAGVDPEGIEHLHCLIVIVTDDDVDETREELVRNLTYSFSTGDHPTLATERKHVDADGNQLSREDMARGAASRAIIGDVDRIISELTSYIELTEARRIATFQEIVVDPARALASVSAFGRQVMPVLQGRFSSLQTAASD